MEFIYQWPTIVRQQGIQIVGRAEDGQWAYDLVTELHPDAVLMDAQMSVSAGAIGYLLKTATTPELRQAVMKVISGTTVITSSIAQSPENSRPFEPIMNSLGLSKREIQILT